MIHKLTKAEINMEAEYTFYWKGKIFTRGVCSNTLNTSINQSVSMPLGSQINYTFFIIKKKIVFQFYKSVK